MIPNFNWYQKYQSHNFSALSHPSSCGIVGGGSAWRLCWSDSLFTFVTAPKDDFLLNGFWESFP
jgi:hypothetical protein